MLSEHFDPKKIMQKATGMAGGERKVVGGSYEVAFYFSGVSDFLVFTAVGLVQARGRDADHVYMKPWEKSLFSSMTPAQVLEKFNSKVEWIEVRGCGSGYRRNFTSYEAFLSWLDFPRQLNLLLPHAE